IDAGNGTQTAVAEVPDTPACVLVLNAAGCEPLAIDHKPRPTALAYDADGNLYVTDMAQATIWRLDAGAKALKPFYQNNDFATAVVASNGTISRVVNPNNGPIPFDAPTGLVAQGNTVLVTNQAAQNDATHWSILSVVVAKSGF